MQSLNLFVCLFRNSSKIMDQFKLNFSDKNSLDPGMVFSQPIVQKTKKKWFQRYYLYYYLFHLEGKDYLVNCHHTIPRKIISRVQTPLKTTASFLVEKPLILFQSDVNIIIQKYYKTDLNTALHAVHCVRPAVRGARVT